MLRSRFFWNFFLSIMAVVLITAVVSVQFERFVHESYSSERIERAVTKLVDFRYRLEGYLEEGEIAEAAKLFEEYPKCQLQFLVYDEYDNEIFGRDELVNRKFNRHFEHSLNHAFKKRDLSLYSTVKNPFGDTYYIEISPKMTFNPWFSPRSAGAILRSLLLVSLCAITCYWLTHRLTQRIHLLQRATHRLANEDFSIGSELRSFGNDELGQLGEDFHALVNQLAESEKSRKQVLSDISHELRSPLARMQVAIEIARMRQNKSPAEDVARQLDRIETESVRMNDLIGQIIHIQKITLDKETHATSPIKIINLLQEIIENVNYEYQQEQKIANIHSKSRDLILLGDAELWQSALENIIRNAMSHTRKESEVSIEVKQEEQSTIISISDCGEGIEAGQEENIFQPFARLDSSRNRKTGGYGLGLAIAKAVVERHGGRISAQNLSHTSGLCITIELPISKDD